VFTVSAMNRYKTWKTIMIKLSVRLDGSDAMLTRYLIHSESLQHIISVSGMMDKVEGVLLVRLIIRKHLKRE
jgi:hypothetical protein